MNNPDTLPDLNPANKNVSAVPTPPAPPAPPAADLGIRTMSSDASSLQSSGGMSAEPKTFNPKDLLGNEPVFNPSAPTPAGGPTLPPEPSKKPDKNLIIVSGIVGFVFILGAVGYFILWPLISKTFFAPAPAPVSEAPAAPSEPTPPPAPEPTPPPFTHASLLPASAGVEAVNLALTGNLLDGLKTNIISSFGAAVAVPAFKEITLTLDNATVDAYAFLAPFFASITNADALARQGFGQDFTGFIYKDKDGIWPGYVFEMQSADAAAEPNATLINGIESSAAMFYVSDPGAQKSDFKDGAKVTANFVWVKYKPYTMTGASFNIGQAVAGGKNYLIFSTSYQGMKTAAQKLVF